MLMLMSALRVSKVISLDDVDQADDVTALSVDVDEEQIM